MEIYTNGKDRSVYLDVPVIVKNDTIAVKIYDADELVYTFDTATYEDDRYKIIVPFSLVQNERVLRVVWAFEYEENDQVFKLESETIVNVYTPLLSEREILEIHPNATAEEIVRIEKAVRTIINAHTGQTFGLFKGTRKVRGENSLKLRLPQRILKIESINGIAGRFGILYDGWMVSNHKWYHDQDQGAFISGGVISSPYVTGFMSWGSDVEYKVRGEWGYQQVPENVKEAAKLLINDYACGDAQYRDRFLTSMTAADWRIQFNSGAFINTGNVRANQLLAEYVVKLGWAYL